MKINWPKELVHGIACRRCVLFFGSGVSMNAIGKDGKTRAPTWASFLNDAAGSISGAPRATIKEIGDLVKFRDYLTAAEVIQNSLGAEKFANALKAAFHEPDFQPAKIHDLLFKLDLRISITPNIDSIYETAVGKFGSGAVTVKIYDDGDVADALRRNERVLIKSHGTIAKPSRVIFSRSAYAEARNKHADFYELIEALIRTHALLFIGCGLDDPDIRALLENYRYRHPQGQRHYFVTESGRVSGAVRTVLENSMKIELIEYQKSAHHAALTSELENLVSLVEMKRADIAGTQTW